MTTDAKCPLCGAPGAPGHACLGPPQHRPAAFYGCDHESRARDYLDRLGRQDHPMASVDPVGALGGVAVDLAQRITLEQGRPVERHQPQWDRAMAALLGLLLEERICVWPHAPGRVMFVGETVPEPPILRLARGLEWFVARHAERHPDHPAVYHPVDGEPNPRP